ncbi:hypothetical protein D3273_27155 [Lichenibacterium minor]|uniref:Rap1a immunity protein domain-containing protein n=1 Tax=Lichenibacterium minor TaxID=2316528 RepID=A0A4Q2U2D6_9HYPH|nr:hypothetical protein [Lichenibacterium minor]RYC28845.1 hypothetical protein D3273_27155 [Lichenibacterium minor]
MRRVLPSLTLVALVAIGGAASAETCPEASAIAFNKLREAISLGVVLKPSDASNPIMCPAAHRVLNAYVQHLALFKRQQVLCGYPDPTVIANQQSTVDRIRTVVIPRYCR